MTVRGEASSPTSDQGVDVAACVRDPASVRYTATCRLGLAVAVAIAAGILTACGGADSASSNDAGSTVTVSDSNTSAGRFPDEELAASLAEAEVAVTEAEPSVAPNEEAAPAAAEEAEAPSSDPPAPAEGGAAGSVDEPPEAVDGESPASSDAETPAGIPAGLLEAGRYTTAVFEPPFSIEIEEGWISFQPELQDFVAFSPADDLDLTISFLSPSLSAALIDDEAEYIDQDPTGDQLLDPVSFNYFDWIHEHSRYEADEIRSELLAGRAVSSFEATLVSGYAWQECLIDCTLLIATSDGELLAQEIEYRERLYTTEVGDLNLVVSIAAPVDKFDAFVARAVAFLRTVELAADAEPPADAALDPQEAPPPAPAEPPVDPPETTPTPPEPQEPPAAPAETGTTEEPETLPPAPLES